MACLLMVLLPDKVGIDAGSLSYGVPLWSLVDLVQ